MVEDVIQGLLVGALLMEIEVVLALHLYAGGEGCAGLGVEPGDDSGAEGCLATGCPVAVGESYPDPVWLVGWCYEDDVVEAVGVDLGGYS